MFVSKLCVHMRSGTVLGSLWLTGLVGRDCRGYWWRYWRNLDRARNALGALDPDSTVL